MRKIILTIVMLGLASGAYAAGFADLAVKAADLYASASAVPVASTPARRPSALDPAANKQLAEKLDIPVFYALPESAYARSSGEISSGDGFLEFRHPGAGKAAVPVGLRVYLTKHDNVAKRLGGGLVQTGDILLTFRPEWGFSGPYPNIQMGVSHAGLAIVDNGVVSNVDNPLSGEYLGELDGKHYKETRALHIIRPRGLSEEQRTNIKGWAKKLTAQAPEIYPAQLSFNRDYFSPKYTPDLKFVRTVAQIALRQDKNAKVDLYCSEFVWALLSLKDCDPGRPEFFAQADTPACVKPLFAPLPMLGNYFLDAQSPGARLGLSDGPLAVIDSMGLPEAEKQLLLHKVFDNGRPLSPGHAAVAASLAPYYKQLEGYYTGIQKGTSQAMQIMGAFNIQVKPNYSPTSYLVNTLLPYDSTERSMDVVGTVVFSD